MSLNNNFPPAPQNVSLDDKYLIKLRDTINRNNRGKMNCTGEVTLTANAATTTVDDNNCNENSVILLTPVTSHAAVHSAGLYVVAGDKQFTIHHSNSTQTDKTFRYAIIG